MTNLPTRILAAAWLLLFALPAASHDYWIEADQYILPVKGQTALHLHVGEDLKSELERPFQKNNTVRFELFSARGKTDLTSTGHDGRKPLGRVKVAQAGTYVAALERKPQRITLKAARFRRYLADEGLDAVIEQRKKLGESKLPGKERYTRYLKCLLQAGARRDDTWKRVAGQRLEIVAQANPYRLKVKDTLQVRILFDGKPLAGRRVFAHHRLAGKTTTQKTVTGQDGMATFKLDRPGVWLVRLVHMCRCADRKEADWESFWAAMTFAIK